jgi:glycosyltransferase involved in cell wall biosynthesis
MGAVGDLWAYYGVSAPFTITRLACLDWPWLIRAGLEPTWFPLLDYSFTLAVMHAIVRRRREAGEAVLYARAERLLPWLLRLKRLLGLRVYFELHNGYSQSWARRLLGCDGVVATTHGLREQVVRAGVPRERCLVAPNAVEQSRVDLQLERADARRQLGLPIDRAIVCYTGQLFPWKGASTLVESAAWLPEAHFLIVGGRPRDVMGLRQLAASRGLANVWAVGQVAPARVPLYQAAADVLVLPNAIGETVWTEYTSPLKLFEYLASGRPIVASDLPSLREVLVDGRNAVLVRPSDPAALAAGIERVLASPALAQTLAEAGRREVADATWDQRARAVLEFLAGQAVRGGAAPGGQVLPG